MVPFILFNDFYFTNIKPEVFVFGKGHGNCGVMTMDYRLLYLPGGINYIYSVKAGSCAAMRHGAYLGRLPFTIEEGTK
jgi:hypothetical protein